MTIAQPPLLDALPVHGQVASRRGGMIGWGIVLIVIGTLGVVGVVFLLLTWLQSVQVWLMEPHAVSNTRTPRPLLFAWDDLVGVTVILAFSIGSVWTGIASCRARRWARPMILTGSGYLMAAGTFLILTILLTLPALLDRLEIARKQNRLAISPYALVGVVAIQVGVIAAATVITPLAMFRFFADPGMREYLDEADPRQSWMDRCPVPVLAWSAGCAAVALSALVRLPAEPTLPALVVVLNGAPAIIGLSTIAVLLGWGAWRCFELDRLAWIVTFVIFAGLRISSALYLWTNGKMIDVSFTTAGAPSLLRLEHPDLPADWVAPILATLEALGVLAFGLWVARYFSARYRFGVVSARP
jgi:hypothetical protein